MKKHEITTYSFSELSDKAKQKAFSKFLDINVNYEWCESIYEDAKNIGLKITSFDLDRNRYCKGQFIDSAIECANKIIKEHGEHCETFKTSDQFLIDRDNLVAKYSDGKNLEIVAEDKEFDFDQDCNELENEFLKSICEDYSIILQRECEYLQSYEAIKETIEANDYQFTEDGKLF